MLLLKLLVRQNNMVKANEFLIKIQKIYCDMYSIDEFSKNCESKEQYKNYVYIKWIECCIKKRFQDFLYQDKYLVYGAGDICKRTLIDNAEMKKNITAIIDQYCEIKEICKIPVIRLDMLKYYQGIHIVIVTLPYQYEEIRKDILNVSPQMKIYSIEELLL